MGCIPSSQKPLQKVGTSHELEVDENKIGATTLAPTIVDPKEFFQQLHNLNLNFHRSAGSTVFEHSPAQYCRFFTYTTLNLDSVDINRTLIQIFQKTLYGYTIVVPDSHLQLAACCCLIDMFTITEGELCHEAKRGIKAYLKMPKRQALAIVDLVQEWLKVSPQVPVLVESLSLLHDFIQTNLPSLILPIFLHPLLAEAPQSHPVSIDHSQNQFPMSSPLQPPSHSLVTSNPTAIFPGTSLNPVDTSLPPSGETIPEGDPSWNENLEFVEDITFSSEGAEGQKQPSLAKLDSVPVRPAHSPPQSLRSSSPSSSHGRIRMSRSVSPNSIRTPSTPLQTTLSEAQGPPLASRHVMQTVSEMAPQMQPEPRRSLARTSTALTNDLMNHPPSSSPPLLTASVSPIPKLTTLDSLFSVPNATQTPFNAGAHPPLSSFKSHGPSSKLTSHRLSAAAYGLIGIDRRETRRIPPTSLLSSPRSVTITSPRYLSPKTDLDIRRENEKNKVLALFPPPPQPQVPMNPTKHQGFVPAFIQKRSTSFSHPSPHKALRQQPPVPHPGLTPPILDSSHFSRSQTLLNSNHRVADVPDRVPSPTVTLLSEMDSLSFFSYGCEIMTFLQKEERELKTSTNRPLSMNKSQIAILSLQSSDQSTSFPVSPRLLMLNPNNSADIASTTSLMFPHTPPSNRSRSRLTPTIPSAYHHRLPSFDESLSNPRQLQNELSGTTSYRTLPPTPSPQFHLLGQSPAHSTVVDPKQHVFPVVHPKLPSAQIKLIFSYTGSQNSDLAYSALSLLLAIVSTATVDRLDELVQCGLLRNIHSILKGNMRQKAQADRRQFGLIVRILMFICEKGAMDSASLFNPFYDNFENEGIIATFTEMLHNARVPLMVKTAVSAMCIFLFKMRELEPNRTTNAVGIIFGESACIVARSKMNEHKAWDMMESWRNTITDQMHAHAHDDTKRSTKSDPNQLTPRSGQISTYSSQTNTSENVTASSSSDQAVFADNAMLQDEDVGVFTDLVFGSYFEESQFSSPARLGRDYLLWLGERGGWNVSIQTQIKRACEALTIVPLQVDVLLAGTVLDVVVERCCVAIRSMSPHSALFPYVFSFIHDVTLHTVRKKKGKEIEVIQTINEDIIERLEQETLVVIFRVLVSSLNHTCWKQLALSSRERDHEEENAVESNTMKSAMVVVESEKEESNVFEEDEITGQHTRSSKTTNSSLESTDREDSDDEKELKIVSLDEAKTVIVTRPDILTAILTLLHEGKHPGLLDAAIDADIIPELSRLLSSFFYDRYTPSNGSCNCSYPLFVPDEDFMDVIGQSLSIITVLAQTKYCSLLAKPTTLKTGDKRKKRKRELPSLLQCVLGLCFTIPSLTIDPTLPMVMDSRTICRTIPERSPTPCKRSSHINRYDLITRSMDIVGTIFSDTCCEIVEPGQTRFKLKEYSRFLTTVYTAGCADMLTVDEENHTLQFSSMLMVDELDRGRLSGEGNTIGRKVPRRGLLYWTHYWRKDTLSGEEEEEQEFLADLEDADVLEF
ncbi:hypothetical protein BLNAU_15446 [Blattamonas nauphoetae]|uniref:Uncharacterized protein n=1 Tax=Blattamonas nauphoetae TaxID=2049346 RepID=A0ABQ9XH15_9EUKA|nr:hypothetical protein BLNAU_15446 [Blattamonas nauphoetae]